MIDATPWRGDNVKIMRKSHIKRNKSCENIKHKCECEEKNELCDKSL